VSEQETKKPGFFGRLFGRRDQPPAERATPEAGGPAEQPATEPAEAVAPPAPDALRPDTEPPPPPASPVDDPPLPPTAAPLPQAPVSAEPPVAPALEPSGVAQEVAELPPSESQQPAKRGWFQRLKEGLGKTSSRLSEGITGLFTKRKLDATTLEEFEDLLIQADLGVETAMRITEALSKGRYEKGISADEVRAVLAAEVERVLTPVARPLTIDAGRKPHVVLVVGVNGTGKTTTIGKLAQQFRQQGRKVTMAAGDTFRAAAIDQLKIWGDRTQATVIARKVGSDSSGLAFDALAAAKEERSDVLLIDTAGRLQNKQALMDELEKMIRVLRKIDPTAPHDVLLVLDATTGQNAISQVDVFREKAGVTGLVMTKLDGTARGGILVAIAAKHGLPVHAIGIGEGVDDLQPFDPGDFARAIAGS
jgi:fused signal recognition particle receptor